MFNIVMFGPPGAGKGTQSKLIIDKYNLIHLSTGDILRGEIANNTQLGIEAKKLIDKGELVPDKIVIGMICAKIEDNKSANGFIFDGFPRTPEQAVALDEMLKTINSSVSIMISLEVDEEELTDRLLKRSKLEGRDDDNIEVIKNRIKIYNDVTARVGDYYLKTDRLRTVSGTGSIDDIFDRICKIVDQYI